MKIVHYLVRAVILSPINISSFCITSFSTPGMGEYVFGGLSIGMKLHEHAHIIGEISFDSDTHRIMPVYTHSVSIMPGLSVLPSLLALCHVIVLTECQLSADGIFIFI